MNNALSLNATIGLLPTSAGKSICYQLVSILTPGTTMIIDPIVALMRDQVQGLKEIFRINRVFAWHASSGVKDEEVEDILSSNISSL